MKIRLTKHAKERTVERGTTQDEIRLILSGGQGTKPGKERKGKEVIFYYNRDWFEKHYPQKKVKIVDAQGKLVGIEVLSASEYINLEQLLPVEMTYVKH